MRNGLLQQCTVVGPGVARLSCSIWRDMVGGSAFGGPFPGPISNIQVNNVTHCTLVTPMTLVMLCCFLAAPWYSRSRAF